MSEAESRLGEPCFNPHSHHSTLRERIVEHLFIGEVLRALWRVGVYDAEILRSEFDAGGYDLVLSFRTIVRHIQFKTIIEGGKTDDAKISLGLASKSSGCIIWIVVSDHLLLERYLWFGGEPGQPLADIHAAQVAKHTKGNADGEKLLRPNHRLVKKSWFDRLASIDEVIVRLIGSCPPQQGGLDNPNSPS